MQTDLRGRDMITTQESTKDEVDTVLELVLDLHDRETTRIAPHAVGP